MALYGEADEEGGDCGAGEGPVNTMESSNVWPS